VDRTINLNLDYDVRPADRAALDRDGNPVWSAHNRTISDAIIREALASKYPNVPNPGGGIKPGGPKTSEEKRHVAAIQQALTRALNQNRDSITLSDETAKFLRDAFKDAQFSVAHSDMNSWAEAMSEHIIEVTSQKAEKAPA
jgi:isocitrate dehydrogenase